MTLPRPNIVLFDMDGTTVRHLNPRLLDYFEKLDDFSYNLHKFLSKPFLWRKKRKRYFRAHSPSNARRRYSPKMMVHRTLHRIRRKPVEQIVEPCPGIRDILDFLNERDIPLGLVSNGLGRGYGHDILKQFDLADYYKDTVFAEDINRSKPDPEPIIKILTRVKPDFTASDIVWYIGDRHKDVVAALRAQKKLSCTLVPIAYGYFNTACLAVLEYALGTDYVVGSYAELEEILQEVFNSE